MKRKIFQWLLVCLYTTGIHAQDRQKDKARDIHISGQIKGYQANLPRNYLAVIFWENHVYGGYVTNSINSKTALDKSGQLKITPDKNGKFNFTLPATSHIGRITVYYYAASLSICDFQLVEPGDNINISVVLAADDTKKSIINFSGHGSNKYKASADTSIDIYTEYSALWNKDRDPNMSLVAADSILQEKLKVLSRYKNKVSEDVYKIMVIDLKAKIHNQMIFLIGFNYIQGNPNEDQKQRLKTVFEKMIMRVNQDRASDRMLALSKDHIDFLYEMSKLKLAFSNNGKKVEFTDLYNALRDNYSGILQEKLLAYCLCNSWDMATFFKGITNTYDYTNCLKDALHYVTTPYLKLSIEKRLNTRGKGANAFDFSLPKDSSDRLVRMGDLKGKVVLVDMWGFICTGCYMFSQAFHEKLYPIFKNNPDFVVVSIMLDPTAGKDHYMRRLRGEGNYTSPEYINLYAGKDIEMQKLIADHYTVDATPFLLLIDKDGKIFSSTLPFFVDKESENINELKKLIEQALNTPRGN